MTNQEIKTVGQTIAAETQIGGNTAERVGGVIEGIGDALDNKDAAVGYYLATMSGSTIYINASSYRLGTGGNLRAKMPAAATTACTLTVGNAQAVQLWYNGAAVSADNSWEAGEIVTIFYDGTRFMASNSQGGGGQFGSGEKIKDILLSQVLGAGTDAITSQKGVSDAIFNEIDISSIDTLKTLNDALAPSSSLKPTYYTVTATLSSVKLKVGSMAVISDNMRHVVTEIMATHYILDDAGNLTNEHSDAEIFFIYRSVKLSGGTLPDPAGTWTKWRYVNSSVWSTVAEKIKYNSQSGLAADDVQGALDELGQRTVIIDSENIINDYSDSLGYMSASGNNVIWISNNSNRKHKAIPVSGEQFVKITAGAKNAKIAFATSSYITPTSSSHGQTISSLCADTGLYNVDANNISVFQIPVDCAYILINITPDGTTYYTPNSVYLGNNINEIVKDNKNAIDKEVIGSLPIALNMKRYIATNKAIGIVVSTIPLFNNTTQNYAYAIIPCSSDDTFMISGKGGSTPRLWCFTDSSYHVISVADSGATMNDALMTAPTGSSYLIVNVDTRQPYGIAKVSNMEDSRIDRIGEDVEVLSGLVGKYAECQYNVVVGSYNQNTGVLGATSDYNRIATAKTSCEGMGKIKTNCHFNGGTARAWILFYNSSDEYIDRIAATYDSEGFAEIPVPDNAAYFAMNLTSTGEDVSYAKFYLQPSNECVEDIDEIEQTISGIDNVEVADADIYLSDFKVTGVDDDTAIEQMLAFGDALGRRTYHIDVAVTISKVIYLKSNTTVLIEEDIKQADGMFECVFRGANVVLDENDLAYLPEKIEQIENIKILGVGNDRLIEGPDVNYIINNPSLGNQEAVGDYYGIRTHQIDLTMCKNFEIANLTFRKTRGWCLNFDFCDHGKIHDLSISSTCKNGDGVDIRTGCHDIEVYNVNGDTADDLLAINSSAGRTASSPTLPSMYANEASGRMRPYIKDRRRFDAHDINVHDCQYKRVVRDVGCVIIVVAKNGTRAYNINLVNLTEISTIQGKINIFLGSFRDTNNTFHDGDVYNVRITRGHSTTSNACVTANKICSNVWVNKCVADNNVLGEIIDHTTNGFTFTNSVGNVVEYPGYSNFDG